MNEGEAAENDAESKLKDAKKKAATQRMQVAAAEKTRVKLSGALDALQPSTIKAKEEFKSFTKKMEKEEAELKKLNEQGDSHTDVVAEISTEIDEITEKEKKEKKLEAEYQEVKEKGIGLTETLLRGLRLSMRRSRFSRSSKGGRIVLAFNGTAVEVCPSERGRGEGGYGYGYGSTTATASSASSSPSSTPLLNARGR